MQESKGLLQFISAQMKMASCPTRLRLLFLLDEGEKCVGELTADLGITQTMASTSLQLLRVGTFVESRREGKNIFYSLADRGKALVAASRLIGNI